MELELIKYVVETFAEKKSEVEYKVVFLDPADMGKVIGKQGKIAKALRTLVSSATPRGEKRYTVEIKEKV